MRAATNTILRCRRGLVRYDLGARLNPAQPVTAHIQKCARGPVHRVAGGEACLATANVLDSAALQSHDVGDVVGRQHVQLVVLVARGAVQVVAPLQPLCARRVEGDHRESEPGCEDLRQRTVCAVAEDGGRLVRHRLALAAAGVVVNVLRLCLPSIEVLPDGRDEPLLRVGVAVDGTLDSGEVVHKLACDAVGEQPRERHNRREGLVHHALTEQVQVTDVRLVVLLRGKGDVALARGAHVEVEEVRTRRVHRRLRARLHGAVQVQHRLQERRVARILTLPPWHKVHPVVGLTERVLQEVDDVALVPVHADLRQEGKVRDGVARRAEGHAAHRRRHRVVVARHPLVRVAHHLRALSHLQVAAHLEHDEHGQEEDEHEPPEHLHRHRQYKLLAGLAACLLLDRRLHGKVAPVPVAETPPPALRFVGHRQVAFLDVAAGLRALADARDVEDGREDLREGHQVLLAVRVRHLGDGPLQLQPLAPLDACVAGHLPRRRRHARPVLVEQRGAGRQQVLAGVDRLHELQQPRDLVDVGELPVANHHALRGEEEHEEEGDNRLALGLDGADHTHNEEDGDQQRDGKRHPLLPAVRTPHLAQHEQREDDDGDGDDPVGRDADALVRLQPEHDEDGHTRNQEDVDVPPHRALVQTPLLEQVEVPRLGHVARQPLVALEECVLHAHAVVPHVHPVHQDEREPGEEVPLHEAAQRLVRVLLVREGRDDGVEERRKRGRHNDDAHPQLAAPPALLASGEQEEGAFLAGWQQVHAVRVLHLVPHLVQGFVALRLELLVVRVGKVLVAVVRLVVDEDPPLQDAVDGGEEGADEDGAQDEAGEEGRRRQEDVLNGRKHPRNDDKEAVEGDGEGQHACRNQPDGEEDAEPG
eukprot:Rhum_TRINITY_DN14506_c15_g1::Rhum_TRINITY_DN14506_c15_g1_i1::g.95490::m.95490